MFGSVIKTSPGSVLLRNQTFDFIDSLKFTCSIDNIMKQCHWCFAEILSHFQIMKYLKDHRLHGVVTIFMHRMLTSEYTQTKMLSEKPKIGLYVQKRAECPSTTDL